MPFTWVRLRLKPLSISHYALGFFLLLTLALGMLTFIVLADMAQLKKQIAQADEKLARQELLEALEQVIEMGEQAALNLARWDEARAQLQDPTYYGYWRNSRALTAGIVPESVDAVDLYDLRGHNLSASTHGEAYMPARVWPEAMQPILSNDNGHLHLYFFAPAYQDSGYTQLIGYAGLKFDFLGELQTLRKFRYVDIGSVHLAPQESARMHVGGILPYLEFKTLANPEMRTLQTRVAKSFFEIALMVAGFSLLGYLALIFIIAKPLQYLSRHIENMKRGQDSLLGNEYRGVLAVAELEKVRQSLNDYQQQLKDMHISLENKNEELWVLAHHDPLTGIFNRRAFDDDWHDLRRTTDTNHGMLAFLLFDCDHFKAINDTYGHQVGDRVIQGLAESLHKALRHGDKLYRLGGDEFATVLQATDLARAKQIAERCVEQVHARDFSVYGVREPVRISVGIAHSEHAQEGLLELLHRQADVAMYHAKRPGHSKIAVYSSDMGEANQAVVSNAETSAVYQAMAEPDRIEMHYQPVVTLPGGKIDYYEALVRIRDGDKLIFPGGIFPVVELRGLESEFDLAILERVLRDLEAHKVPANSGISINVSGPSIVNEHINRKLMKFAPLLKKYKIVLEVTETSLITQIAQASANLNSLRKSGFVIALDDFGSGYSSLRYLASMPVDLVKFDISMIRSLEKIGRQALFVEDLARMIKDAGYKLVAEGIESEALLKRVTELGFSHAQGYHIGRPAPLTTTQIIDALPAVQATQRSSS